MARKKAGKREAEVARLAGVEVASVKRVENAAENPGILVSLKVGAALGVTTVPDTVHPVLDAFVEALGSDPQEAASLFDQLARRVSVDCAPAFAPEHWEMPKGLLWLVAPAKGVPQLVMPKVSAPELIFLPHTLGRWLKAILSRLTKRETDTLTERRHSLYWDHLAAGRMVNPGCSQFLENLAIVEELLISSERQEANEISSNAERAYLNALAVIRRYEAARAQHDLPHLFGPMSAVSRSF
ncbi:MAG: hypothetical protein ACFB21_07440 [Opitutales bacterium]